MKRLDRDISETVASCATVREFNIPGNALSLMVGKMPFAAGR